MTLLVDVLDEDGLKASDIVLFALPGVGDVGKNAIELLNEANNATPVARFIHPGLTPSHVWMKKVYLHHHIS